MPIMVGRPANRNAGREPYVTIGGVVAPGAVVIQIFIADYVRRNILRRGHFVFPLVAPDVPLLKIIGSRDGLSIGVHLVRAGERVLLAGGNGISRTAGGYFTGTTEKSYHAGSSIGADVEAVFASAENR
jgi:hypothetical protein